MEFIWAVTRKGNFSNNNTLLALKCDRNKICDDINNVKLNKLVYHLKGTDRYLILHTKKQVDDQTYRVLRWPVQY